MEHHRLYHELAHLWPILSPPEEYAVESWHLKEILQEKLGPGRHSILTWDAGRARTFPSLPVVQPHCPGPLARNAVLSQGLNPPSPTT